MQFCYHDIRAVIDIHFEYRYINSNISRCINIYQNIPLAQIHQSNGKIWTSVDHNADEKMLRTTSHDSADNLVYQACPISVTKPICAKLIKALHGHLISFNL